MTQYATPREYVIVQPGEKCRMQFQLFTISGGSYTPVNITAVTSLRFFHIVDENGQELSVSPTLTNDGAGAHTLEFDKPTSVKRAYVFFTDPVGGLGHRHWRAFATERFEVGSVAEICVPLIDITDPLNPVEQAAGSKDETDLQAFSILAGGVAQTGGEYEVVQDGVARFFFTPAIEEDFHVNFAEPVGTEGQLLAFEFSVVLTSTSAANSLATLAMVDAYLQDHPFWPSWERIPDGQRARFVVMASRQIDVLPWLGVPLRTDQKLSWDRIKDNGFGWDQGWYDVSTTVPRPIVHAVAEQALHLSRHIHRLDQHATNADVGLESAGSGRNAVRYREGAVMLLSRQAQDLVADWLR